MSYFVLSTLLSFAGLAAALLVLTACILLLWKTKERLTPLLYLASSSFFGFTVISSLIRQKSGIACAMPTDRMLLLYGGLILLHLYFLFDLMKLFPKETA